MRFALIGAAGYVAPRHMKAIKDTGHELVAALDPCDSVGILDSYFPDCKFFTDEKRFDRHIMRENHIDYMSICSPNYLHESHCKMGMRLGANVICEKPLALCSSNIEQIRKVEKQMGKKVYTILQSRLHPTIKKLKERIDRANDYKVELKYITPRGPWYLQSWKGRVGQSGGIETNIGIHFFDMLQWIFGPFCGYELEYHDDVMSQGILYLESAEVKWFLSINRNDLPDQNLKFFRSIKVDDEELRFDDIIADYHTDSYIKIFEGNGFTIDDAMPSIEIVSRIREECSI
jgi:UDP-N-acetyl-2-amino-2-deoxyglucuronate dehydrogenase